MYARLRTMWKISIGAAVQDIQSLRARRALYGTVLFCSVITYQPNTAIHVCPGIAGDTQLILYITNYPLSRPEGCPNSIDHSGITMSPQHGDNSNISTT